MGEKIPARWQRLRDAYAKLTTECDRLKEENEGLKKGAEFDGERWACRDKYLTNLQAERDRLKDELKWLMGENKKLNKLLSEHKAMEGTK